VNEERVGAGGDKEEKQKEEEEEEEEEEDENNRNRTLFKSDRILEAWGKRWKVVL
jgi:hypothetical protein